jgi:hypothetical protein
MRELSLKQLAWTIVLLLPLGASAAEIYRFVDDDGSVVYSDRPKEGENVERIEVRTAAGRPTTAAVQSSSGNAGTDGNAASPLTFEVPREPTPEEIAADRARNCAFARSQVETLNNSRRMFRNSPSGEPEYLSAAEIDAERAKAEANVAEWCD